MRSSSLGMLITIFLLVLSGCRKDSIVETKDPNANCYCCEQIIASDTIEFGNLNGMNILYPDRLITSGTYPGSGTQTYEIDIDQDGINDLKLIKEVQGSYTTGPSPQSKIEVLNDETWIAVSAVPDTLYYFETDTYYSSNPVIQNHYEKSSCTSSSTNDSILSITDYVNYYQQGDQLYLNQNWSSEIKTIEHYNANFPYHEDLTNPDTTIYWYYNYYNDCHDIPYNSSVYIGLKKYYCGEQKLGWIRLTLGNWELHIEEIAIQK